MVHREVHLHADRQGQHAAGADAPNQAAGHRRDAQGPARDQGHRVRRRGRRAPRAAQEDADEVRAEARDEAERQDPRGGQAGVRPARRERPPLHHGAGQDIRDRQERLHPDRAHHWRRAAWCHPADSDGPLARARAVLHGLARHRARGALGQEHCLPRPEAGERDAGSARLPQAHRLWHREEAGGGQEPDLHDDRHAALHGAGDDARPRLWDRSGPLVARRYDLRVCLRFAAFCRQDRR
mmetsp:Transcript_19050/g.55297  ORF Transcript_19050/g.55297 Transcript_19050/m.55297 type:complete len:239 (+) Transcript_19050:470-1186(+)